MNDETPDLKMTPRIFCVKMTLPCPKPDYLMKIFIYLSAFMVKYQRQEGAKTCKLHFLIHTSAARAVQYTGVKLAES